MNENDSFFISIFPLSKNQKQKKQVYMDCFRLYICEIIKRFNLQNFLVAVLSIYFYFCAQVYTI